MTSAQPILAQLNDSRSRLHAIAQREKTRAAINRLQASGKTAEQILEALLTNPPVVDPQY